MRKEEMHDPEKDSSGVAQEYARLPEPFRKKMTDLFPPEVLPGVMAGLTGRRAVCFRLHRPGVQAQEIIRQLADQGLRADSVRGLSYAFCLGNGTLRDLEETEVFRRGDVYVQNLSSMLAVSVLAPGPGEAVLDLAAAPGSKTTQIAWLMQGRGLLTANDAVRSRFYRLKTIVEKQGLPNVHLRLARGEMLARRFPHAFDRVLLDAPCSSEGRFDPAVPETFRYWKPAKVREMAGKQKVLLPAAFSALKTGGRLVYSTCTFSPEENEAVIARLMELAGDSVEVEEPVLTAGRSMPGLRRWQGKSFPEETGRARRVLPDETCEGFFICSLRKKKDWTLAGRRLARRKG